MATFSWVPDVGMSGTTKPRVKTANFGDGYRQDVADGINTMPKTYNLKFTLLPQSVFEDIMNFLEARGGHEAFDWTPPGRAPGRYICPDWSDTSDAVTFGINATFQQVYGK